MIQNSHMERYLEETIRRDMGKKIIILSGPRQVGKTTLSKQLVPSFVYLNYDSAADRRMIKDEDWPRDTPLVIFDELHKMGLVGGKKPRMISVQAEGCAPIVKAFLEGKEHAETWENPQTLAAGLRVPGAIGDFLMLRAIRESGGTALTVTETVASLESAVPSLAL